MISCNLVDQISEKLPHTKLMQSWGDGVGSDNLITIGLVSRRLRRGGAGAGAHRKQGRHCSVEMGLQVRGAYRTPCPGP
jgi:hypothetical protein